MKKILAVTLFGVSSLSFVVPAQAQPGPSSYELRDDIRDLQRFQALETQFNQAMNARDPMAIRSALSAFVMAGREEVRELQAEVQRAQTMPQRWGGRRDFAAEASRLQRTSDVLRELEATAAAEVNFGPRRHVLVRAQQLMGQFVELAREELQATQQSEMRRNVQPVPLQPVPLPPVQPLPPGSYALRDDFRDLQRFEALAARFDQAVAQRDAYGIRNTLNAIVAAGREEVRELQAEVQRAQTTQAQYWGGRRDFAAEVQRLQRATALLSDLERRAVAEANFGPQQYLLAQARQLISQFIDLAREELRATQQQELRGRVQQPPPPSVVPVVSGSYELRDDIRDLQRFEALAARFDQSMNQRDMGNTRAALGSFVQAGREEVQELQTEVQRAQMAPQRWGGRRNFAGEFARLQRATALLQQLEAAGAGADASWGQRRQALMQGRQLMSQFIELAREELTATQQKEFRRR